MRRRPVGTIPIQTREALRDRAKCCCERCGRSDRRVACQAHHRRLKSQGGSDDLENLAYLCFVCHGWAHGNRDAARLEGWIIDLGSG